MSKAMLTYRDVSYFPWPIRLGNGELALLTEPYDCSGGSLKLNVSSDQQVLLPSQIAAVLECKTGIGYELFERTMYLVNSLNLRNNKFYVPVNEEFVVKHLDSIKEHLVPAMEKFIDWYLDKNKEKPMKLTTFNSEDYQDHRTVALAARLATVDGEPVDFGKFLFSINLKHRMITFPIGKCHPNESLLDGLIREMKEEIDVNLQGQKSLSHEILPCAKFTRVYDFTGKPVTIETNVFFADWPIGDWACVNAHNKEPDKCGGLFIATYDDAINMSRSTGLKLADCVVEFFRTKTKVEM